MRIYYLFIRGNTKSYENIFSLSFITSIHYAQWIKAMTINHTDENSSILVTFKGENYITKWTI